MILAAVAECGAQSVDGKVVRDEDSSLEDHLISLINDDDVDVVITSGGVSMGRRDLVKPLLERMGTVRFGRLEMKPGKPTTFAVVHSSSSPSSSSSSSSSSRKTTLFFALPGNPVSSLVTFNLLVAPALRRLSGLAPSACQLPKIKVRTKEKLRTDGVRREYHRAMIDWRSTGAGGEFVASSTGIQVRLAHLSLSPPPLSPSLFFFFFLILLLFLVSTFSLSLSLPWLPNLDLSLVATTLFLLSFLIALSLFHPFFLSFFLFFSFLSSFPFSL